MRGVALTLGVLVLVVDLLMVAARTGDGERRAAAVERPSTSTTAVRRTTTTTAATTTVAPAPPSTAGSTTTSTTVAPALPSIAAAGAGQAGPWTLGPLRGTGVWLDVYDWTHELTGGRPSAHPVDVDTMAARGIQTLYIQTAHRRSAADVIEPERLRAFIDKAHAHDMSVVAWYLPTLEDTTVDLRRLVAAARLPVDGLGVDIESRAVADPAERTRRLLELSARLRQAVGSRAIAAITPSAVHLQVINPGFWPGFPWPELATTYDALLPMAYWSIRRPEYRSGERYIGENIDRIRASTGRPEVPIHPIGGIADGASPAEVAGMVRAIQARGVLGGSLYDWNTSNDAQWAALRPLRSG